MDIHGQYVVEVFRPVEEAAFGEAVEDAVCNCLRRMVLASLSCARAYERSCDSTTMQARACVQR